MTRVFTSHQSRVYSFDQGDVSDLILKIFFVRSPFGAIQPSNTNNLIRTIRWAEKRGLDIIIRGAGTSPLGQTLPMTGRSIIIDMSKMDKILDVNPKDQRVIVEAGVRWAKLENELKLYGLVLLSEPSSIFSTVGGWISTGGCGIGTVKFGHIGKQLDWIEIATLEGQIQTIYPDNPEILSFIGAEGQMGVITKVALKVRKKPKYTQTHLIYFRSPLECLDFLDSIAKKCLRYTHASILDAQKLAGLNRVLGKGHFKERSVVVIRTEGKSECRDFEKGLKDSLEKGSDYLASLLWLERFFPMRARRWGPGMLASEHVMRTKDIRRFIKDVRKLGKRFGVSIYFEMHAVSKELFVILSIFLTDSRLFLTYLIHQMLTARLMLLGIEHGGLPYGVGIWNSPFDRFKFSMKRLRYLKRQKSILDPGYLLNGGKFLSRKPFSTKVTGIFLSYFFFRIGLKFAQILDLLVSIVSQTLGKQKYTRAKALPKPSREKLLEYISLACTRCSACVEVCPAYIITRDERTTAKGKLLLVRELLKEVHSPKEDMILAFLCTRCKACKEVCQSQLPLLKSFDVLEEVLVDKLGFFPLERIKEFLKKIEENQEYLEAIGMGVLREIYAEDKV